MSFKIWKPDGLDRPCLRPGADRTPLRAHARASGRLGGQGHRQPRRPRRAESAAEAALGMPLLEVYSPLHEVWSGEIIAVAEFYEVGGRAGARPADARRKSWLLVAGVFLASGLMLLGIVRAGSRTIARQKAMLEAQIGESRSVAAQNVELRRAPSTPRRGRPPGRAQPAPGQRRPARRPGAVRGARRDAARQPGAGDRGGPARGGDRWARRCRPRSARSARSRAGSRCPSSSGSASPRSPRRAVSCAPAPRRAAGRARAWRGPENPEVDRVSSGSASTASCRRRCRTPRATRRGRGRRRRGRGRVRTG